MQQPETIADAPPRGPGRPRSTATPEAIRGAATKLFAEHGFGGTSVRDIASAAGSDPAVVIRQFGSKEKLFLEVLTLPRHFQGLVEGPRESLGREILRKLIEADDSTLRLYKTLLGASDRPDVRQYLEQATSRHIIDPLAERLAGSNRRLRAQLVAAQIAGLLTSICLFEPMSAELCGAAALDQYAIAIQALIDGLPSGKIPTPSKRIAGKTIR
jgi:AcrR family transcriptional regulator